MQLATNCVAADLSKSVIKSDFLLNSFVDFNRNRLKTAEKWLTVDVIFKYFPTIQQKMLSVQIWKVESKGRGESQDISLSDPRFLLLAT